MQPTRVVLGVHWCWWTHLAVGQWLWWKGASLVVGARHVDNVCCVGRTWVLVDARHCGLMAVVEGLAIGAGDAICSQRVLCWAYVATSGRESLCVDVVVQPRPCAARGLLGLKGGGKRLWESAHACWGWFLDDVAGCWPVCQRCWWWALLNGGEWSWRFVGNGGGLLSPFVDSGGVCCGCHRRF